MVCSISWQWCSGVMYVLDIKWQANNTRIAPTRSMLVIKPDISTGLTLKSCKTSFMEPLSALTVVLSHPIYCMLTQGDCKFHCCDHNWQLQFNGTLNSPSFAKIFLCQWARVKSQNFEVVFHKTSFKITLAFVICDQITLLYSMLCTSLHFKVKKKKKNQWSAMFYSATFCHLSCNSPQLSV